jgi:hypothetical protein
MMLHVVRAGVPQLRHERRGVGRALHVDVVVRSQPGQRRRDGRRRRDRQRAEVGVGQPRVVGRPVAVEVDQVALARIAADDRRPDPAAVLLRVDALLLAERGTGSVGDSDVRAGDADQHDNERDDPAQREHE